MNSKKPFLAYLIAKFIVDFPLPKDNLFMESWVYEWGALLFLFMSSIEIGRKDEGKIILKKLLKVKSLPTNIRQTFQLEEWDKQLSLKN
jgi:hypothetical protein